MKPKKRFVNSKSRLLYLYIESSSRVHAFAKENEYLGVHCRLHEQIFSLPSEYNRADHRSSTSRHSGCLCFSSGHFPSSPLIISSHSLAVQLNSSPCSNGDEVGLGGF